VVEQNLRL